MELSVQERIKEIERFLDEQEQKSKFLKKEEHTQPTINSEVVDLLKKIVENQEIDRKRFERNNPIEGDDPIYDWAEATIGPEDTVIFTYTVPEGRVFFLEYLNVTHQLDTVYYIWIDGQYQPTLSYALQDFGDHAQIYKPPKICYSKVEVWCVNDDVVDHTYSVFFRGFNRWSRKIKEEIVYESLNDKNKSVGY